MVHFSGVILERGSIFSTHGIFQRSGHFTKLHLFGLSGNTVPNLSRRVGGDGGVRVAHLREESTSLTEEFGDELQVQPHAFSLGANNTFIRESISQKGEKFQRKQGLSRTFVGVRRVNHDDIKVALHFLQILKPISNHNADTFVIPPNKKLGEELLGFLNDNLVNLAQNNFFDILVLDQLRNHSSVSSSNDQNSLGVGVSHHRGMSNHFLVRKLIPFSQLNSTIQHQHSPIVL
mmetsp:Transcript_7555/g.11375  ORF Transcript_7555/g.11375 Transcript_7555/m.11375 type:complete len:233 (+) Transcript_7555:98-796(+)